MVLRSSQIPFTISITKNLTVLSLKKEGRRSFGTQLMFNILFFSERKLILKKELRQFGNENTHSYKQYKFTRLHMRTIFLTISLCYHFFGQQLTQLNNQFYPKESNVFDETLVKNYYLSNSSFLQPKIGSLKKHNL